MADHDMVSAGVWLLRVSFVSLMSSRLFFFFFFLWWFRRRCPMQSISYYCSHEMENLSVTPLVPEQAKTLLKHSFWQQEDCRRDLNELSAWSLFASAL